MSKVLDTEAVFAEFRQRLNMAPSELERWLRTEESRAVGMRRGGSSESVGHRSGERIVALRRKRKAERTSDDVRHMAKVVGYIKRHCAQGPTPAKRPESRWRYSLMNWGHDPLKRSRRH